MKIKTQSSKPYHVYKKKYNRKEYEKIKREGIVLRNKDGIVKINPNTEMSHINIKDPRIALYNDRDIFTKIVFSLPENADKAFVDFKPVKKNSTPWVEIFKIDKPIKNKEYEILKENSFGQNFKYRVTYQKDGHSRYADISSGYDVESFFEDPPEIFVSQQENLSIKIFNVNRFSGSGYLRIFKKENENKEKCIYMDRIKEKKIVVEIEDSNIHNYNFYSYRAEVYDNLGNIHNIEPVKIYANYSYQKIEKEIKKIEKSNKKYFVKNIIGYCMDITTENSAKIEIYNIEREVFQILDFIIDNNKLYFYVPSVFNNHNFNINVTGMNNDTCVSWGEISQINSEESPMIYGVEMYTNSKFENVIKWRYSGKIDSFIVAAKSSLSNRIIETISHRTFDGCIYFIDEDFKKERVITEYIINGLDEFNRIITNKRISNG